MSGLPFIQKGSTLETVSRSEIEEFQTERLRNLVRKVWDNNPFYRKLWSKAGIKKPEEIKELEDLRKLPIVFKSDIERCIRENPPFGDIVTDVPLIRVQGSSGTTGKTTYIFFTRNDWDNVVNLTARRLYAQGVRPGDRVQITYAFSLFIAGWIHFEAAMRLGCLAIPAGSGAVTSTERQLEIIKDLGATVLCGTPSYILHLGEVAQKIGMDPRKDFKVRIVSTAAEPLTEEMRRRIEDVWGCKAYNSWGSVETGSATFECVEQAGMHIFEDSFIFEFVDPITYEPVQGRNEGVLVVTSLWKEAMPLIRYCVGDIAVFKEEPCKCGRTFKRILSIKGRVDHMIKVKGVSINPQAAVENVIKKFKELSNEYFIEVDKEGVLDSITVNLEYYEDRVEDMEMLKNSVSEALHASLGVSCKVRLWPFGELKNYPEFKKMLLTNKVTRVVDRRYKQQTS